MERLKSQKSVEETKRHDEKLTESLRQEAQQARRDAEKAEKEYAVAAEERDKTRFELEEMRRMYAALERRMKAGERTIHLRRKPINCRSDDRSFFFHLWSRRYSQFFCRDRTRPFCTLLFCLACSVCVY